MKRYITIKQFREDYLFNAIDNQELSDEKIQYAIGVASTRVDTIVGGAIRKGIRGGYYLYADATGLTLDETKITDPMLLAEAKDATEALYEQISAMTKFALDTGWDFLSGSFSTALGSQADSETIDFESSLAALERTVREALNIYDFGTLFYTEEIDVAFDDEIISGNNSGGQPYVPAGDRLLTEAAMVARLTSQWLKGQNGITIELQVPGQPDQGIVIKGPDGKAVPWLTDDFANVQEFSNTAKDFAMVKYNLNKDGSNNSQEFNLIIKTPNGIKTIKTWEEIDTIMQAALALKADKTYVNDELGKRDTKITANSARIDALSGGVKIYHYATKADADTAKATITFNEGDLAWIGTSGNWIGYHFIGGNWVLNGTTSGHTATIDAYTKAEADAKFEPKIYDYSASLTFPQLNNSGGKRFQIIPMPAGVDQAVVGVSSKMRLAVPADPTNIPQDGDQITYGTDLIWIDKSKTDIMSWSEIKANVADGKVMVIKKIEVGNWELLRWENSPTDGFMDDGAMTDLENTAIATK